MKTSILSFAIFVICSITTFAQEGTRSIEGTGQFNKYLTPGLLDRWVIEGKKGETVIAHVSTDEFDPVLELAIPGEGEKEDTVLFEVDDNGSESRFSTQLPDDGKYAIRVHGYKYKGGGNYALQVRRFQATEMKIGKPTVGTIDRDGKSYRWLRAKKDQMLKVDLRGSASWEILDVKGRRLHPWSSAVTIEEDGEYSIIITGGPASRYELTIRPARQLDLEMDEPTTIERKQNEIDIWNFEGKPGDFRLITIEFQGSFDARLIYAPREKDDVERIEQRGQRPPIQFISTKSKGRFATFAAVLGRESRYQLQLAAKSNITYTVSMQDPSIPIEAGQNMDGTLSVGGSTFYSFQAKPGQLLSASLKSEQFDPVLTLYNDRGDRIASNDDGDGGMGSLITHMIVKEGTYRLHAQSLGGGGSGDYKLELLDRKLRELKIGDRDAGTLAVGRIDFWKFTGRENQTFLINVRSSDFDPTVSLYSPDGVRLAGDDNGGVGTDSLLAVMLPKSGTYTIWISPKQGAGLYTVRLLDGD